tara:strand:- start:112 stop:297 length:186 start_codon:yes stop_codon:yes gene_type:complete
MEGKSAIVTKDIQSSNGMLYKSSNVLIKRQECSCTHGNKNILIEDDAGRQFWVGKHDILIQ